MKYKLNLFLQGALFLLTTGFLVDPGFYGQKAVRPEEEVVKTERKIKKAKKKTAAFNPTFVQDGDIDYIKLASKGGLCGGVTLKPKKALPAGQQIVLQAFHYKGEKEGEGFGKKKTGEYRPTFPWSIRAKYDWAGLRPSSHYRIYCYAEYKGVLTPLKCSEYIKLEGIKHNVPCIFGGASRRMGLHWESAKYKPFKMNKG
ncbi:hypothetical protein E3J79_01885 [Candidatus Dependentiae bacterium]|nr:MAG: hypothetical protein E3J79_01885 [Candidatus Dependentiae bacterium]